MLIPLPRRPILAAALLLAHAVAAPADAEPRYAWRPIDAPATETLAQRIAASADFVRAAVAPDSFAEWLRGLPLKPTGAPVLLHTGAPKGRQDVHVAVIDVDTGTRDLQQCADAAMRLRAEWLFATARARDVAFNATGSGQPIAFARWAAGERPRVSGRSLSWSRSAAPDAGYASFRRYLDTVFIWAGTLSLAQELPAVSVGELQAGDLFIKGGTPGHAVLVADLVENRATGEKRFLLLQSFMPAQDIHVLKNPGDAAGSPWYPLAFGADLVTPEWTFPRESLRRWKQP